MSKSPTDDKAIAWLKAEVTLEIDAEGLVPYSPYVRMLKEVYGIEVRWVPGYVLWEENDR